MASRLTMPPEAEGPGNDILPVGEINLCHVEHDAGEVACQSGEQVRCQ